MTDIEQQLRDQICKIFGVFSEELEFDLPGGIGTKKMNQLLALIKLENLKAQRDMLYWVRDNACLEDIKWIDKRLVEADNQIKELS